MFQTSEHTAVVSSTTLKREYQKVKDLLGKNMMVFITNRGSDTKVDGVLVPYTDQMAFFWEEFLQRPTAEALQEVKDSEEEIRTGKFDRFESAEEAVKFLQKL